MSERTVLITGASTGIGAAIARELAADPRLGIGKFALVARREAGLRAVADDVRRANPSAQVAVHPADIAREAEVNAAVDATIERFGGVDYLINNAGYVDPKSIEETTLENLELTTRVNLFAPFLFVRRLLLARVYPRRIVNVASTAGLSPRPGWIAYAATKAALINMTQTMSDELAPFGIKVVAIAPGRCATELRQKLAPDEDPRTIMQPQEVAGFVRYLLSDMGDLIDKQCLVVKK